MLNDLKILNGNLELKFDKYTYEYTVTVDSDIDHLELSYKLDDDATLEVIDNDLTGKDNIVTLKVRNGKLEDTYTLYVRKDEEVISGIDDYKKSLEVIKNEEIEIYKVQILGISIFLTLIVIFTLMFKKEKKINKN